MKNLKRTYFVGIIGLILNLITIIILYFKFNNFPEGSISILIVMGIILYVLKTNSVRNGEKSIQKLIMLVSILSAWVGVVLAIVIYSII